MYNPKEDYLTNDIEGAAYFESMRNQEEHESDKPSASEFENNDDFDEEPDCNCSDRDCPCGGRK